MEEKLLEQWDIMTPQSQKQAMKKQAANDLESAIHISPKGKNTLSLIDKMLQQAYQYNTLSKQEEVEIITQLELMDFNKDRFSKGSEGSVFKIVIQGSDGKPKEYLVAKKRYDNNPINEWHVHKRIQDVIQNSQIDTKTVTIPELKAVLNVDADNFIIMEFVKGKTLYQLQLEEILKKWGILVGDVETDVAIESMFFKALNLNQVNPEDCKKASGIYYQELKNIKLFSPEQGKKYKEALSTFIKTIHKDGLYHRDGSNPRNIMISENGVLYVIDFGRSIDAKGTKMTEKQIYESQEGEHIGIYPRDEEILLEIDGLTKTIDDVEYENENKQIKEKISIINKGDSIISLLKTVPSGRAKAEKKQEAIIAYAKEAAATSKYVKLIAIKETKTEAQRLGLLLAQSYENIESLQREIAAEKDVLAREKQREEAEKKRLPVYVLKSGQEAMLAHQQKYQKKIDIIEKRVSDLNDIEKKLGELKNIPDLKK